MGLSKFVKLIIPPFFYLVKSKLKRKAKISIAPLEKIKIQKEYIAIIGNGPSLNLSIEKNFKDIIKMDRLMVNHSASTVLYEKIQPNYYLLVDPAWIYPNNSAHKDAIFKTIDSIVLKTTWSMKLIMPNNAYGCYAVKRFQENKNIHIHYYNDQWSCPKGVSQLDAWDQNLIAPPAQTVLNTAVWLSIYWGYKETYLIGADTSFLSDLKVDQQTNLLYTIDTHFYNNKEIYENSYDDVNNRHFIGTKLHEELFAIGTALKDYWDMKVYADWKRVKVYNASEYSWIDAFERKKLE